MSTCRYLIGDTRAVTRRLIVRRYPNVAYTDDQQEPVA